MPSCRACTRTHSTWRGCTLRKDAHCQLVTYEGRPAPALAVSAAMSVPSFTEVLVDHRDSIATITINRPEQRNALSQTTMSELRAAFAWCRAAANVNVVVLTGA